MMSTVLVVFQNALIQRDLLRQLCLRELAVRYQGSILGMVWAFAQPISMLLAYVFVFSVVFRARWGNNSLTPVETGLNIFIGILLHGFLAECLARGPLVITASATYVKKVIFPLELIPITLVIVALVQLMLGLILWFAASVVVTGTIRLSVFALPLLLLPLLFWAVGLTFLTSAVGVFVRDVSQVVGMLTTLLLFFSPVFYPVTALPGWLQACCSITTRSGCFFGSCTWLSALWS
jgi:lipopolysaccharide transport system permease protein